MNRSLSCVYLLFFLIIGFPPPLYSASTSEGHQPRCAVILTKTQEDGLKGALSRFYADHAELFLKDLPNLVRTAGYAGISQSQIIAVLHVLLNSREYIFLELGDFSKLLIQSFEAARKSNTNLSTQVEDLKKIVAIRAVFYALNNLPLAIRYGWTLEQIAELYGKLERAQGGHEMGYYILLPKLMRSMIAYNVDKEVSFLALRSLFSEQYTAAAIEDLPDMIEHIELGLGHSADSLFEQIPKAVAEVRRKGDFAFKGVEAAFRQLLKRQTRLSSSNPNNPSVNGDFPLIAGPVRHSNRPYQLRRTYDSGIGDLRDLCLSLDEQREGAFVFDPSEERWFSLGGHTEVDFLEYKVRTTFMDYDLGELSLKPKFVHIHPKSLEWWSSIASHQLANPRLKEPIKLFSVILPSRQDISTFLSFIRNTRHDIQPEFVIVHSLGKTIIQLGEDLSEVDELLNGYIEIRDSILLDRSTDLGLFDGSNTQEVLEWLVNRLNDKLNKRVHIRLEFAESTKRSGRES
ncbi:MAG: hypothetical protein IPJ71_11605 [Bdellovibrionales bacterium]|nr:hypothetical protein [Bdellovibrionales bacterium]